MAQLTGNPGMDKWLDDNGYNDPQEQPTEEVVETEQPTVDEEVDTELEEQEEEQVETTEESEEEVDDFYIDLETDEETIDETTQDGFNFSELSEALNADIKTKDDVVTAYNKLATHNKELEAKLASNEDGSANLPDVLKKAIEISKQGGDFYTYLDLNSQQKFIEGSDAKELYTNYLAQQPYFAAQENPREALREYIEDENPTKFQIEADAYKQGLMKQTSDEISKKAVEAELAREKALFEAKKAIDSINDVYGVKIGPKQKQQLMQDFQTGEFTNKLLYNSSGEADYAKMVRIAFLNDNFEKIMDIVRTGAKNQTKRDMISKVANKTTKQGSKVTTKSSTTNTPFEQAMDIFKRAGGMGK